MGRFSVSPSHNKALERTAVIVGWRVSAETSGDAAAQRKRYAASNYMGEK